MLRLPVCAALANVLLALLPAHAAAGGANEGASIAELVGQLKNRRHPRAAGCGRSASPTRAGALEALPNLIEALRDRDSVVRDAAMSAIGTMGPKAQIARLLQSLNIWTILFFRRPRQR